MLAKPMDVRTAFPVRKSKKQKQAFRDAVQSYAASLDYASHMEQNRLVIGDPKTARFLLTAGDSDSGILTLLEILRILPENRRDRVCFVLFENGIFSVYSYWKAHPEAADQLVFHLEHVGEGDRLRMFPTKKLNANRRKLTSLYKACGYFGKKSLLVEEKNFLPWYVPFPYAVHIASVQGGKNEAFGNRIRKAEAMDETNINILRAALTTFICCDAAQ